MGRMIRLLLVMLGQSPDTAPLKFPFLVALLALLAGCRGHTAFLPDHPAYFDALFRRVDSMNLPVGQAFRYVDSVYNQFPNAGTEDQVRHYDYKGGYYYMQTHDLRMAMVYVDSCLGLLSYPEVQQHYQRLYAKCLIDKAETYQLENKYESAFFYYKKGLEAIQDFRDSCSMAEYTQRIAMASYRAGRFVDAICLFDLAFHQFSAHHGGFRAFAYEQCNLDNIGQSYAAMGRWDSAAYYYDSALSFISRSSQPFLRDSSHRMYIETARAVVYGNQGDVALYRHDTTGAWILYRSSISTNMRPLHDSGNAFTVLVKAAHLHLVQGQLAEARAALQQIRAALAYRPNADLELSARKLNAELLAKTGDTHDAWTSLNSWANLVDSLHAAGISTSNVDVPGELMHLEDRYTIHVLRQRDQIKTAYLLLALLIVVMLAAIVFLIRRGAIRSKGHIRQLNRLNKALNVENRQTQTAINALNEDQAMYLRTLKTIAHDLRNPVGAISSAVSLLRQQSDISEKTKPMLGLIQQAADQSLQLVGGIMHLDLQMGKLERTEIDLARLLSSCAATLQFKAADKCQTIHVEAEAVTLLADHDKLWRVIINLLDNAIKFSPEGADINITLHRQDDKAVVFVSDRGIGIPSGMEEKLFTVDAVKRSGTGGEKSFGLGLAIVNQIIKAHGGTISVESKEHQGTTFRIELQASAA